MKRAASCAIAAVATAVACGRAPRDAAESPAHLEQAYEQDVLVTLRSDMDATLATTRTFGAEEIVRIVDERTVVLRSTQPARLIAELRRTRGAQVQDAVVDCSIARFQRQTPPRRMSRCERVDTAADRYYLALSDDPQVRARATWGLRSLGLTKRLLSSAPQETLTVAVLDTGVDAQHPDFQGSDGQSIVDGDPPCVGNTDVCAHGTQVAGVIAARVNNALDVAGAAPFVKILSLKITNEDGVICQSLVQTSLHRALAGHASIINISAAWSDDHAGIRAAVEQARPTDGFRGALIVAGGPQYLSGGKWRYPAAYADAYGFVVSAMAAQMDQLLPSQEGGSRCNVPTGALKTLLAAPGSDICTVSPPDTLAQVDGDSFALPFVSALAALTWTDAAHRSLTAAELRETLFAGACATPASLDSIGVHCAANARFLEGAPCPKLGS